MAKESEEEPISKLVASKLLAEAFRLVCSQPDQFGEGRAFIESRFTVEGVRSAAQKLLDELSPIVGADTQRMQNLRATVAAPEDSLVRFADMIEWLKDLGVGMTDAEAQAALLVVAWQYDHDAAENAALPQLLRELKSYPRILDVVPEAPGEMAKPASFALDRFSASRAAIRLPRAKTPKAGRGKGKPKNLHGGHEMIAEFLAWAARTHPDSKTNDALYRLWPQWPLAKSHKRPKFQSFKRYRSALKGTYSDKIPAPHDD